MSDIKLFRLGVDGAEELVSSSVAVEKTLQKLIERNLETLLGVRFLESEYSTGKTHGGRIDTLGLDENNNPVIVEYKRALNENVINQGLFYLDWLLDHRAEFTLLAMKRLDVPEDGIDWSAPRLVCIAGDFTRYDEHAVAQINRNVELVRYRRYGDEFLILELVNVVTATGEESQGRSPTSDSATVSNYLKRAPRELKDLFGALEAFLVALGEDVQRKTLQNYFAFRRIKNFACVEVHPQAGKLSAYVKVDPDSEELEEGFTRDVRSIGHFGTGDLEITIRDENDLERAKRLFTKSYEVS